MDFDQFHKFGLVSLMIIDSSEWIPKQKMKRTENQKLRTIIFHLNLTYVVAKLFCTQETKSNLRKNTNIQGIATTKWCRQVLFMPQHKHSRNRFNKRHSQVDKQLQNSPACFYSLNHHHFVPDFSLFESLKNMYNVFVWICLRCVSLYVCFNLALGQMKGQFFFYLLLWR